MIEIAPGITVDETVRFDRPVIRGTRVPVDLVVGKLAGGMSAEDIANEYGVSESDIRSALAYAARTLADERIHTVR
jgi:uncharacterized protein (DUF433 family)